MTDEMDKLGREADLEGAELASDALAAWDRMKSEPIDDLAMAAYLDGLLNEYEQNCVEARLASDSDSLALLRAAREALAASAAEAPPAVIDRLRDLVPGARAQRAAPASSGLRDWIEALIGSLAPLPRPLAAGLAVVALIACSTTGFELGRTAYANVAASERPADDFGDGLVDGYPDLL